MTTTIALILPNWMVPVIAVWLVLLIFNEILETYKKFLEWKKNALPPK